MNDLERHFRENTVRRIHKWNHYFDIYDRHFARFRGTDVHLVEIGVAHGGSLRMWKEYFGPECRIFGVDVNPRCRDLEEDRVEIFIGDQGDRRFLRRLAGKIPRIDVLVDDGGHTMEQQIHTFEELFPHVDANGVYVCEDLHTSFWPEWGGGYRREGTFLEYAKDLIDQVHAWHSRTDRLSVTEFTRSTDSLHFYDSVLVIEKRPREEPFEVKTGTPTVPDHRPSRTLLERARGRMRRGRPSR